MTQEAIQITTAPPLPGLQLVQDLNKAFNTLATDFAGPDDPSQLAGPYMTWADTSTGTIKRRNAAGLEWVIEGRLFRSHLPMYPEDALPTTDVGPIYIIGTGPAEWGEATYKPLMSGIPSATFAEISALTEDQGPIVVHDMCGTAWTWVQTAYFTGYRSPMCGEIMGGNTVSPRSFQVPATGGVLSESDPKERRVIAHFREQGLVLPINDWAPGWSMISDLGDGNWKAPDLQDMFLRMSGTDADTANARTLGQHQADSMQRITASATRVRIGPSSVSGAFALTSSSSVSYAGSTPGNESTLNFDSLNSPGARAGAETRPANAAVSPFIHI